MNDFEPAKDCLKDKTILITGTGSGIGKTAAKTLSQFGAQLILLSKDTGKLESLYEEIVQKGFKEPLIHPMNFESAQEEEYLEVKEAIQNKFDKLDGLINNAGVLGEKKPLSQYQYSIWKKVLNVNLDSHSIPFSK